MSAILAVLRSVPRVQARLAHVMRTRERESSLCLEVSRLSRRVEKLASKLAADPGCACCAGDLVGVFEDIRALDELHSAGIADGVRAAEERDGAPMVKSMALGGATLSGGVLGERFLKAAAAECGACVPGSRGRKPKAAKPVKKATPAKAAPRSLPRLGG